MKNRDKIEVLINPTKEQSLEREPLLAFSFYLSTRNNLLLFTLDEIVKELDNAFADERTMKWDSITKASDSMWFWTLGAYEVVRTIDQAKECFSEDFISRIKGLKRELAIVRMPSAKMEEQGKPLPVNSNRSPDGWDIESKDLLVGKPENPVSARFILDMYDKVIRSLTPQDVLKRHEDSYVKASGLATGE